MVSGNIPPKILRTVRRLNSAVTAAPLAGKPVTVPEIVKTPSAAADSAAGINLSDAKELFSSVSTFNLLRSSLTLQMAAVAPMVDFGIWVMNSRLMENPIFRRAALAVTERTFYAHFCAGKDLERTAGTVQKLRDSGLSAMLDYGLEHAGDNESCDRNLREFVRTIDWTKSLEDRSVSFVVVKITAICPSNLLKRVSDLLRWEHKDRSLHLPWKLKALPIFTDSTPLYHTPTRPNPLTADEESDLQSAQNRLDTICQNSLESGVPLLVDAEDTSVQPAIDYLTYSAAVKHSGGVDSPLLYNTIQAYLKDAEERLVAAKKAADGLGIPVGFKLVRGAYMSSENELARSLGVKSPIHETIEKTHECYNHCAEFLMEEIAMKTGAAVLATHNIESCKFAAGRAADLGIDKDNRNLQFAQLHGMAEALSYGLRNAGFRVSKYLPFGPVDQVIPYLLRRAEENRGLLSSSSLDRQLMRKELVRRFTSPLSGSISG
ncbi:proline dehydrogenase 1, mitochondrial-like [Andrographis paniculata]|uniref:proline dehydrogenase 1, mitochondrial-like n=1 Tax=Andrographis paniculata TaxID=175694 RepID=UPI0021E8277E|nr:proline dehydrogenase 1, mitochondrial-like [Andrographis paniculata]